VHDVGIPGVGRPESSEDKGGREHQAAYRDCNNRAAQGIERAGKIRSSVLAWEKDIAPDSA